MGAGTVPGADVDQLSLAVLDLLVHEFVVCGHSGARAVNEIGMESTS
jgi:hypothetical protein